MSDLALYFREVSLQVGVMFLLIAVGFLLTRKGILNDAGARTVTDLILYAVTPAVILKAFVTVRFSPENATSMLIALGSALAVHLLGLGIGALVFRRRPLPQRNLYICGVIFSNGGYMSLPLAQVLLGDMGTFLVSMYVAVFNVVIWTLGVKFLSHEPVPVKKLLLNPNLLAVALGIVLFFARVDLTGVTLIYAPMTHLANLNAPVAMIVIGYYLCRASWKPSPEDASLFAAIALRILAVPLIAMGGLRLLGVTGDLLTACAIPACAPVAAMVMMFVSKFGGNTDAASKMVALAHLLSIVTIPLMLTLCKAIGG